MKETAEPHGRKKAGNLCGNGKPGERNDRAQTVWLDNENQRKRQIKRRQKKRRPQIRQEAEQHAERDRDRLSAFRRLQKRPCVSGHRGEQNQGENPGTHRNSGTVRRQKHRQKSLPDIAQDAEQSNPRSGH